MHSGKVIQVKYSRMVLLLTPTNLHCTRNIKSMVDLLLTKIICQSMVTHTQSPNVYRNNAVRVVSLDNKKIKTHNTKQKII